MWCTFSSIWNECRNKYVPKKAVIRKKKPMWMDSAVIKHKKINIPNV